VGSDGVDVRLTVPAAPAPTTAPAPSSPAEAGSPAVGVPSAPRSTGLLPRTGVDVLLLLVLVAVLLTAGALLLRGGRRPTRS
jgi:hypothetical protein